MANILNLITVGDLEVLVVDADPSASSGTVAPVGSLALFNNSGVGLFYQKVGAGATAWLAVRAGLIDLTSQVTNILPSLKGGTGLDSSAASNGQLLIGNGAGFSLGTLTSGIGMSITNNSGSVTVTALTSSKQSTRVATTANLTATYSNGTSGVGATLTNSGTQAALSIDGVSLSVGDRVLVKNQTTQTQNGIYTVTTVGSGSVNWVLTRSTDFDNHISGQITEGNFVFISEGTVNQYGCWIQVTSGTITLGSSNIVWKQTSASPSSLIGLGNAFIRYIGTSFGANNGNPYLAIKNGTYTAVTDFAFNPNEHNINGSTLTFELKVVAAMGDNPTSANIRLFNVTTQAAVPGSVISIPTNSTTETIYTASGLTTSSFSVSGENIFELQAQTVSGGQSVHIYSYELRIINTF